MLDIKKTILEIINEQTEVDMSGVEVKFDDNIPLLAICKYNIYRESFSIFITDVTEATEVIFNLKLIEENLNALFVFEKLINKATKPFLKHVVLHELRHVWQTRYNKDLVIKSHNELINISGYGSKPVEADANLYARSKANNKFEAFVSDIFTYCQNMKDKAYITNKERFTGIKYILKLYGYAIL